MSIVPFPADSVAGHSSTQTLNKLRTFKDDSKGVQVDVPTTTSTPVPSSAGKQGNDAINRHNANNSATGPPVASPSPSKSGGLSISTVWEGMKRMMGFTEDCHNGGYKTISGQCICPQFFEGKSCERIMCVNNGSRVRVAAFGGEEVCKCPHPDYISGKHCEVVHCQNGGRLLNDGTCHCIDGWYNGQFCQFYTSSWLIAIGVPLLAIAAIAFCCVICRLDLCAMRRAPTISTGRQRNRRSNGRRQPQFSPERCRSGGGGTSRHRRDQIQTQSRPEELGGRNPNQFYVRQNLLNDRQQQQQYVIHLEQIPAYNPRQYIPSDQTKPLEPPPPYEQAILCSPPRHDNCPPNYCPAQENGGGRTTGVVNGEREEQNGTETHTDENQRSTTNIPPEVEQ